MQVLNQKKKMNKIRKSHLLLFGSFLIFCGVVCLSWNYLQTLKEEVFENVRLKLADDSGTSEEIESLDIENINNEGDSIENTENSIHYNYIGYLEIPKIGLKRGFVSKGSRYNDINYNIAISEQADYPNVKNGNFILMAHSGDAYISFFAYLYRLEIGDRANVVYNNKKYQYKLVKIEEQPKTGVVAIHRDNYKKNALTLITCTKDNDFAQTIYIFELV